MPNPTNKPFAESCEQNKLPILEVLKKELAGKRHLLEISSGTGQHAVYFAQQLPELIWQTSELQENIPGINAWIDDCPANNVQRPFVLDCLGPLTQTQSDHYDALFSANSLHIMSWQAVEGFFKTASHALQENGTLCLYGPFNYNGKYTSESNQRFDQWLKQRDPRSGIRDTDDLNEQAMSNNLRFVNDHEMPANNRILVWRKL